VPEPRPDPGLRRTQRAGRDRSDDDVLVAPGYLAGSAYCGDDAFVPLTHHYWHDMSDEMGNFYVTTMGSQLRVAYLPEASELMPDATALWQIRCRTDLHAPPTWTAAFTDETPPEIVAAVTAALDADVTAGRWDDEPYRERDDHPEMVWEVLRTARWQITVDGWHITATSPDRLARLEYRPSLLVRRQQGGPGRGVARENPCRPGCATGAVGGRFPQRNPRPPRRGLRHGSGRSGAGLP
jgi:hypothetical protein